MPLLSIKDHASSLDGLPLRSFGRGGVIVECRMDSDSASLSIIYTVVDLDEGTFVRPLVGKIPETVIGVVPNIERRSFEGGVESTSEQEITFNIDGSPFPKCQRVVCDWVLNRTPDIDDPDTAFEKTFGIIW